MLSDINVCEIKPICSPKDLLLQYAPSAEDSAFVQDTRNTIEAILTGKDPRFLVIVGPCSIHSYDVAIDYAKQLLSVQHLYPNLFLVMRVYFEKPRTRKGWKGFIYDPDLDESFQINKGLELARRLLLELTQLRVPIGSEFLDTVSPQYLADLVSWGAIGARTSESQIHRQLASGLSMPVGFKNLTSGDYEKAIDGIVSASLPHNFLGIDGEGKASHVRTRGNPGCHLILRGGLEPNYEETTVRGVTESLQKEGLGNGMIVDCSHGNSQKEYNRQLLVALYVKRLFALGRYPIRGIMLESNLRSGSQKEPLEYGVSITDACMDIATTKRILSLLNSTEKREVSSLDMLRQWIHRYDDKIYRILCGETPDVESEAIVSAHHLEEDALIMEACKGHRYMESLLMMISGRISFSNRMSEIKFQNTPFAFLRKDSNPVNLITHREIERTIYEKFPYPLFLKIMDISKTIQLRYLRQLVGAFRIGYLFGKGTFSHEASETLQGIHIAFPSIESLRLALRERRVDAILVPTYNSIIGAIHTIGSDCIVVGTVDHRIRLSVFSNKSLVGFPFVCDRLYVEPHIQAECAEYIARRVSFAESVSVESTVAGCVSVVRDTGVACTISSVNNACNLLCTLDTDIVPHNVTTFSLVMRDKTDEIPSDTLYLDSHYC